VRLASDTLKLAGAKDAETLARWANQSPEHALTVRIPQAWARFSVTVTMKEVTSKSSGNPYHVTKGTVQPASAADFNALTEAYNDADVQAWQKAVDTQYDERINNVRELVAN
jgi:hypothetical protein